MRAQASGYLKVLEVAGLAGSTKTASAFRRGWGTLTDSFSALGGEGRKAYRQQRVALEDALAAARSGMKATEPGAGWSPVESAQHALAAHRNAYLNKIAPAVGTAGLGAAGIGAGGYALLRDGEGAKSTFDKIRSVITGR